MGPRISAQTYDFVLIVIVVFVAYFLGQSKDWNWRSFGLPTIFSENEMLQEVKNTNTVGTRKDHNTGLMFAPTRGKRGTQQRLLGIGTRKKAILNIYSVGIYAAPSLEVEFHRRNDKPGLNAEKCQVLLEGKAARSALLQFKMAVGAEKIAEAVNGIPGISKSKRDEFYALITEGINGKLKSGESMSFEWKGRDKLEVFARGASLGTIRDMALAQGVLGLYVGPKSVSPSLLKDLNCL